MGLSTKLCEILEIEAPVILAPMAGVSGGALASAVSNAGGLGLIGGGYGDRSWLTQQFEAAGNARVGIGFIGWALERQPELLDFALDHEPKALLLSFGLEKGLLNRVARSSAKLIVQVQTEVQARDALERGADVIVAQGTEAGGHGGRRATFPLVPAIVDIAGEVPVVAAGGIVDGRGLAAALMLGASGVLCGTGFFTAHEALSHPNAKSRALAASGDETARSSVFDVARGLDWPSEWNLRTLRNPFLDRWQADLSGLEALGEAERLRYRNAVADGDMDTAAVIVGEATGLVSESRPAAEILQMMVREAEVLLSRGSDFVNA